MSHRYTVRIENPQRKRNDVPVTISGDVPPEKRAAAAKEAALEQSPNGSKVVAEPTFDGSS